MSENKTSKYFKYAIGEIILVVIGILIALQINNWNISRLERNTEQNILKDLKVEFTENLKDASRVYQGNMGIVKATIQIQDNILESKITTNELDSLLHYVFDWFDYTSRPGASNNLVNSGSLNIIQNQELRKMLTLWSGVDNELNDDEQLAIRYSQDIIIPFLAENYPISNLEKFDYNLEFYNKTQEDITLETQTLDYDILPLLNNSTFQSHISAKKMYARHNAMEAITVIKTCESILNLIESELNTH